MARSLVGGSLLALLVVSSGPPAHADGYAEGRRLERSHRPLHRAQAVRRTEIGVRARRFDRYAAEPPVLINAYLPRATDVPLYNVPPPRFPTR